MQDAGNPRFWQRQFTGFCSTHEVFDSDFEIYHALEDPIGLSDPAFFKHFIEVIFFKFDIGRVPVRSDIGLRAGK
jgi:hypothetical protein